MRIQLASDLHLELLDAGSSPARLIEPAPGADLLVLAGDVHSGVRGIDAFADWPTPVIYVPGNHELYRHEWERVRADLRSACSGTNVTLLDNDVVDVGGLRILGATLWTDFRLRGNSQDHHMGVVERGLNDYSLIQTRLGVLRAWQTLADHEHSRGWLEAELSRPFNGPTVVVTHHGPHALSVHPRFAGHPLNPGFVSDLTPLLYDVDLWLHGHVHDSVDYRVGRCRVVANPAGYATSRSTVAGGARFELENELFDPRLVIDVPV